MCACELNYRRGVDDHDINCARVRPKASVAVAAAAAAAFDLRSATLCPSTFAKAVFAHQMLDAKYPNLPKTGRSQYLFLHTLSAPILAISGRILAVDR